MASLPPTHNHPRGPAATGQRQKAEMMTENDQAPAARALGRAVFPSHALRISSRRASTCALAASKFGYTFVPLIVLQGVQQATRLDGS